MPELEYRTLQAENSSMFESSLNALLRENHGWRVESCGMPMRTVRNKQWDQSEEVWWAILSRPLPEWKRVPSGV